MNQYLQLKSKHAKEVSEFPMKFAFTPEQKIKGMKALGLNENEEDKIYDIGAGGFIRTSDIGAYKELFKRHEEEIKEAIKQDKTGEGFILQMFRCELANHEYGYTEDLTETLECLDLDIDDINENENLKNGLCLALKEYELVEEEEVDAEL